VKDIETAYAPLTDVMIDIRHNDASDSSHEFVLPGGACFIYVFRASDLQGVLR
jgi:hypothetical protein